MCRTVLLFVLATVFLAAGEGDKYLAKIPLFQKDSYFKKKVYDEHNWKTFYALKEPQAVVNPDNYDMHLLSAAFFFVTNKLREEKKLEALRFSPELRNVATVHTHEMVMKDFFSHYNTKTAALRVPADRVKMFGVNSPVNGENIDMNSFPVPLRVTYLQIAEVLVKDLYDSPPHRKMMLDKNFRFMGCAAIFEIKDEKNARTVRATQDFSGEY